MSDSAQPERIGLRYLSLGHRLRRVVDDHMTRGGLSLARTKVLQILAERGSLRQTSLADELGYAPRSVTQAVDALERDKLVERATDPADRRCKIVTLTPAGAAALAAGTAAGQQVLRRIFGSLDQQQQSDLAELLNSIEATIESTDLPDRP
jgi:DNA-binding MarR family transcriptional regulator